MVATPPPGEIEVLGLVCQCLDEAGIDYMLTGSFALAFYATPRMTRDIDLVVALSEAAIPALAAVFERDFYFDPDDARDAVRLERMFNLMHLETGIKVDFIVRKRSEYRQVEFARRQRIRVGDFDTWIVSREDLVLSKLLWSLDSGSELQRRDVKSLLTDDIDTDYLRSWASRLGVQQLLEGLSR